MPKTVGDAVGSLKRVVLFLFLLSGVVNVLALTGSWYMLQVYDRVIPSQSVETLIALSILAAVLYLFQGGLDVVRSQILVRLGSKVDDRLGPLAHRVTLDMPRQGYSPTEAAERGRDVDTIRQFLASQGPVAVLDLPWVPLYLMFIYLLHPVLALVVVGAIIVLACLTIAAEFLMRRLSVSAQQASVKRAMLSDTHIRNFEALRAMGMTGRSIERFHAANRAHLTEQLRTGDVGGTISGITKALRMMLQSAVLGLGAYLTILGEMSAGAIIAASVAAARALAPIDMAIGSWKGFVAARHSLKRLKETLMALAGAPPSIQLPRPSETLKVEGLTVAAPGTGTVVLNDVSFTLKAGQGLGLIGPSGSGKSSLVRAITGIWPQLRGSVRLDDAAINQWEPDELGKHIGYLPQQVALLDGTIAENISRFDPHGSHNDVISAAKAAGVHELIVQLPNGYDTRLGVNKLELSAGQRQRLGLARALYKSPFLIVLDEPNSNLDADGDAALNRAISNLRKMGSIVIIVAHRPSAIGAVDKVGIVQGGRMVAFGQKEEVLSRKVANASTSPTTATPPAALKQGNGYRDAHRNGFA